MIKTEIIEFWSLEFVWNLEIENWRLFGICDLEFGV
jgi:hypothetical protein